MLAEHLRNKPVDARIHKVTDGVDGEPVIEQVRRAAGELIMMRLELLPDNPMKILVYGAGNKVVNWLPEPLLVMLLRFFLSSQGAGIKLGHAERARSEMRVLWSEFRELIEASSVPTPAFRSVFHGF